MRVIIVGAGIAGLTLALRLQRLGWEPLVVERAPRLRGEGYMIDFFGPGFDAAERMNLLPRLEAIHHPIGELLFVDGDGRRKLSVEYAVLRRCLFANRHFNFLRGDLEASLYDAVGAETEIRFDTTVSRVAQGSAGVDVELNDGTSERADVLVGADGVHSRVRALAFGPEERFRLELGHLTAAYILERPPLGAPPEAFTTVTAPGRMVAVYPIPGNRAATFFVHRTRAASAELARGAREVLPGVYGDLGSVAPDLLAGLADADSVYFDELTQVRLDRWVHGRVALLGDAAWCVSLLAGQGASLALGGADLLADELHRDRADPSRALSTWARRMGQPVAARQRAGVRMARWFVPTDPLRMWLRTQLLRTSTSPLLSRIMRRGLAVGRAD